MAFLISRSHCIEDNHEAIRKRVREPVLFVISYYDKNCIICTALTHRTLDVELPLTKGVHLQDIQIVICGVKSELLDNVGSGNISKAVVLLSLLSFVKPTLYYLLRYGRAINGVRWRCYQ